MPPLLRQTSPARRAIFLSLAITCQRFWSRHRGRQMTEFRIYLRTHS